jgi:predicted aconitase
VGDLRRGYEALNGTARQVDLVSIGCPHASPWELTAIARGVSGRCLSTALWVTTAREVRDRMADEVAVIEAAGGRVVADTCMVVAPMEELGYRVLATNSAKMATYAPAHSGMRVRLGHLQHCIEAAVTGRWPDAAADSRRYRV